MARTDPPGFLLFSGANDRALIALCRGMSRYSVPFGLIGRGKGDLLKRSRYGMNYLLDRTSETLHFEEIQAAATKARSIHGVDEWVICPTSEYLNLVLFPMRDRLQNEGITVATCDENLYGRLSEKAAFRSYCTELGVPPPRILEATEVGNIEVPFVAKPKTNLSAAGRILYPFLVRNEKEKNIFVEEAQHSDYYVEEFVTGESWYLLFYIAADGTITQGAQRNLLQQGKGKSIVLARAQRYPDQEIADLFANHFRSDGYRGFIMVEVRRTGEGGAVTIEANPRCWGPLQLTLDANMGLVEAFLSDHGHSMPACGPVRWGRQYCWSGGILQAWRSGMGLDRHDHKLRVWPGLVRGLSNDVFARNDAWSCFRADLCRA